MMMPTKKDQRGQSGEGFLRRLLSRNLAAGFTVTEVIVVMGIIIIILTTLIGTYPRFRNKSSLASLARRVALVMREAQVFGLAVKEFPNSLSTPIGSFPPYGFHIDLANPQEMILFADVIPEALPGESVSGNGIFDTGLACGEEGSECFRRIKFASDEFISDLCVTDGGGQAGQGGELDYDCASDGITRLDVTFRRPDPEARILANSQSSQYNAAQVYLSSTRVKDDERIVRIWITGQISVE